MGGNKRVIAVLIAVTAAAAIPVWLADQHAVNVHRELLAAATAFDENIPADGSVRFTYDGITFDEEGWIGSDGSLTSSLSNRRSDTLSICDSVTGSERVCYQKYTRTENGYVPEKWFSTRPVTVANSTVFSSADFATTSAYTEDGERQPREDGVWSRDGNTYTMTESDPDGTATRHTFTFTDSSATHTVTSLDSNGDTSIEFVNTWAYDPDPHLFTPPAPNDVYTPAEADAEKDRILGDPGSQETPTTEPSQP